MPFCPSQLLLSITHEALRPWLETIVLDIPISVCALRRSPDFTLTAIVTLGIGIGINAAVFTVTNAVLFKGSRLVERNDRILYIDTRERGRGCCVSYPDFEDWRAQAASFEGMGTGSRSLAPAPAG